MPDSAALHFGGIAVIGYACRVPGADGALQFWDNLVHGVESIRRFTRNELIESGVDPAEIADPAYVPAKGAFDQADGFDAGLFGYAPREAALMDPQHRVMLECAWEALEHGGYGDPDGARVAVYAGVALNTYLLKNVFPNRDVFADGELQLLISNDKDFVPTRISYQMNLAGPSVNVQTACSTSLVAVQMACQSLLAHQCDMALAGGAAVTVPLRHGYLFREGGILSADGHCRPFDAGAGGTVPGNGAGMVLLKRLEDAAADRDVIHAVIIGAAVNNDGGDKIGYTAPSIAGQSAVIAQAHAFAGVTADTIGYVEAHGTATPLGDPIEVAALTSAFRRTTAARGFCALGSVKSNIGHLDTAAGIVGLIKAVLTVQHGIVPPSLHFQRPNPACDLDNSPFFVPMAAKPWLGHGPRRACVSSFGIGGTNAHVVIEAATRQQSASPSRRKVEVLCLSARTGDALARAATGLAAVLEPAMAPPLADTAFTLALGRHAFAQRRAVVATTAADAAAQLRRETGPVAFVAGRNVAWLYPGQGAQRPGMGAALSKQEPDYRAAFEEAADALSHHGGPDLRQLLWHGANRLEGEALLAETADAQAAIFATEYALARLWTAWGIRPAAVLGHSIGEFAAAVSAGVMSLNDAARLVAARGRLMQTLPRGAMLSVACSEEDAVRWLRPGIWLCAVNAPNACVLGGPPEAVAALEPELSKDGIATRRLHTSHAFHTGMMDPMLAAFRAEVANVALKPPDLPWLSSMTAGWMDADAAVAPDYWVCQLRRPVRFGAAVRVLLDSTDHALLEVGPGDALTMLARRQAAPHHVLVSSTGRVGQDEAPMLARAAGTLWASGARLDWGRYYDSEQRRRVALPSYPFERQRHWIDSRKPAATPIPQADLPEQFLFEPCWIQAQQARSSPPFGKWLLIGDETGLGGAIRTFVAASGGQVSMVSPLAFGQFERCLAKKPDYVVHLGSVTGKAKLDPPELRARGYRSLVALGDALAQCGAEIKLTVVSDGMQAVTGQETICADKALILGPVRVLPQEYPALRCRSVDVEPVGIAGERLALLLTECTFEDHEPVVAHRGGQRWVASFRRLASDRGKGSLRRGGVYLISGGLGGVGLTLARHLWERTGARLVLTARTALAESEHAAAAARDDEVVVEIGDDADRGGPLDALIAAPTLAAIDAPLETERGADVLTERGDVAPLLDELSVSHIYQYFRAAGFELRRGSRFRRRDLAARLSVVPAYVRFVDFFVRVLIEDGFAAPDGDEVVIERAAPAPSDELGRRIVAQYPWLQSIVELLAHSAAHFPDALSGRIDALAVLYPKGESDLFERVVAAMTAHTRHLQYGRLVGIMLRQLADRTPGPPLRILEVGGGNGFLTRQVAAALAGCNAEYVFTDISRAFVERMASRTAPGLDDIKFGIFDISRDGAVQGWREPFDVVLALDAVHATKDVKVSLDNLRRVLRPGGVLYMLETLPPARWNTVAWGLARDWWSFDDHFRIDSPLLSSEQWLEALYAAGFATAGVHRSSSPRADCALYFAQNNRRPADQLQSPLTEIAAWRERGADILTVTADVTDAAQMTNAVSIALKRFGAINGVIHAASDPIMLGARGNAEGYGAKARGARVLGEVLADLPLDFLLLCSSTASFLGGIGMTQYVAENAFLDGLAHEHGQRAFPVISVNWGYWQGVGMGRDVESQFAARTGEAITGQLTPEQALACFDRIAGPRAVPQAVATSADLTAGHRAASHDIVSMAQRITDLGQHARSAVSTAFDPPVSDLERRIAAIWEETLGTSPIGRQDDYFELGGDSLIAIKVIYRLHEQLGLQLRVAALFEAPTVAALARHIEAGNRSSAPVQAIAGAEEEGEL
jgi:acyl transferase domain-containing protein/SAM-dependent methyltransferase/acyl carrier protein